MNSKYFFSCLFACLFAVSYSQEIDPFNIGDIGPGGGVIFYKKSDWTDGWRYLEAAPRDWINGNPNTSGRINDPIIAFGTSTAQYHSTSNLIGTGDQNTLNTSSFHNNYNNAFYNNFYGDKRGWFLPSRDELRELYNYKRDYGNDVLALDDQVYYNSSTDPGNVNVAWTIHMGTGVGGYSGKGGGLRKRAIRKVVLDDVQPTSNKSIYFSSSTSSVNLGSASELQLNTNFTRNYVFWIKPEGSGYIFSKYKNLDSANSDFFARYDAESESIIFTSNGTGSSAAISDILLNQWSFISITVRQTESGNEMKGYVNGVLKITQNINVSNTQTQQNFYLGFNPDLYRDDSNTDSFQGYLDEFSIWTSVGEDVSATNDWRPFNSSEITSYMEVKPNGYESRLLLYMNFDQENFDNLSRNGEAIVLNNEYNAISYSTDTPYEYQLSPTDLGFWSNDSISNTISVLSNVTANSDIGVIFAEDPDTVIDELVFTLDNNSGNQNHNERFELDGRTLKILFNPGLGRENDTDVEDFLTSANIENLQIKQALNTFVYRLKENGLWGKLEAIYPFVGGDAISTSYNLKDPSSFQINWPGDFTFSDSYVRSSGSSSADTGIGVYNSTLSTTNSSVGIYVSSNEQGNIDFGAIRGAKGIQLVSRNSSNQWGGKMYTSENRNYDTSNSIGFIQASRKDLNTFYMQKDSVRYEIDDVAVLPDEPRNLSIGGLQTNGFSAKNYSYASAGESLTEDEMDLYYSFVDQLQIDLGRKPGDKSVIDIDQALVFNIDVLVSDGQRQLRKTLDINIVNSNVAPTVSEVTVSTEEDTSVDITLLGTDLDGDTLTYTTTEPSNGVLSGSGQVLTYTPNANYEGTDSFTYVVNDGTVDSAEATVTITVTAVNDTPTVSEVTASTDEDTSVDITLLGEDIDGDTLTFSTTAPSNGTLSGTGSAITYTPDANYEGTDSFTYTVNDGTVDSETATVTITINPINDVPIANDVAATTDEDTGVEITLVGSDLDGDSLSYEIQEPSNGSVILNGEVVTYTPNANYEGTDSFTYVVNDGTVDSAEATVTITVTAVNDTPTVSEVTASTDEDTSVDITLLGEDIDGDTLTFSTTAPSNGTLSGTGSAITYTPDANYEGTDSFTYTVNDGTVDSETATVTITINPINDVPIANDVAATTDEDTGVEITLVGSDLDGDSLSYEIQEPSNGSVILNGEVVTYTPNANYEGTDSFTYVVNDGTVDSAEATVTITVTAVNDTPTVSEVTASTDEDTSVDITLLGEDIDGDTLTFSTTAPSNGTLSGTGSAITYTPDANYEGTDSFTYTVNDGTVDSETATVTITINPINDVPIANDVAATTDEDTGVEITLVGSDLDGDSLSYEIQEPSNGSVILNGEVVTYTPNANYEGTDSFTYVVNDGTVDSAEATVTITVTAVNDAPEIEDINSEVNSNGNVEISLSATDVDSEIITFEIVSQPEHGVVEISGNKAVYSNSSYLQTFDQFTYRANDGELDSDPATIRVSITPHPEITATSTIIQSACGAEEGSITLITENTVGTPIYSWTGPDDFTAETLNIEALNPGTYTLVITDEITSKTFEFEVPEKPIYQDLEICYVTTDPNTNHNRIVLKYPGIYNDQAYQILREGTEAGVYELIGEILAGETSFLDTTSNNTSRVYSYKVRLKDNCDNLSEESPYHNTILLQSSVATDNSVNLNWSRYEGRTYSSYLIYRSINGEDFEQIATISSNSTSFNDTEADISVNAYTYYIAIQVNSCELITVTTSKSKKQELPLVGLETESVTQIQSNRKQIATLNNPPTVQPVTFSTEEDTAVVITLSGSDEDGDALSFSASQPQYGEVTISGTSLTYTPDADYFGTDSFTYTANDGGLTSEAAAIEVSIAPINDAPSLSSIEPVSFSEATEIGTLISTLSASDVDGDTVSYSLLGDSENNFVIEGNTVLLNNSFDYESKEVVTVSIVASDGELTDTKDLVVTVEDVPNNSVEQEYAITIYDVANEDNTEKLDYTQWTNSTENTESGDFIFEISGGEDAALFTIDPVTGALDFIEAPDYENPSDANGDNVYIVIVKITNINDGAPEVPVVTNQTTVAVPEAQTAAADVDAINTTNQTDTDEDGVVDTEDNCPTTYNPGQEDTDGDGVGDVCDDSDMDTFFDAFDDCPNSELGVTVDAKGCEVFALPSNTFTVSVTSATCPDSSNGQIIINSNNTDYSYRYAIDDQAPVALTDNTQTISNLSAGIYTVCVTVDGVSDYQRCYTIEITEPAPLVASSRIDMSSRNIELDLSGSKEYQVTINGKSFLTSEERLSLNLEPGMNRVEVATALDCQGVYFEEIFVSEEVKVYPNPTKGPLQLFVAGSDTEVELNITTLSGNVIRRETMAVPMNRIIETSLSSLPEGLYLITLNGTTVKTTHKVIKE